MPHDEENYERELLETALPYQRLPFSRRIFAHISLAWIALLFATGFYTTTSLYSWHPYMFSKYDTIGRSPARAFGFLAILVQLGGIFLASSICHTIGVLASTGVARKSGIPFLEFLALHAATSFEGWAEIMWRSPKYAWRPRVWTVLRFLCITIVPILGIVIMSDVNTVVAFYAIPVPQPARGYGIGEFNASLATILQPMADNLFSTRFKDFTSDSDLAIDITENTDRVACENFKDVQRRCRTTYLVPGGIQNGAPVLLNNESFTRVSSLQPVLALNQTGYIFDFEDGLDGSLTVQYEESDGVKFGFGIGAVQLCLKNRATHVVDAFLTRCPKKIAASVQCMSNATWPLSEGWGTSLSLSTQQANIGYNGQNGTILYHELLGQKQDVNINAAQIRNVFDTLFNQRINTTTEWGQLLSTLGIASNRPVAPLIIWEYFEGLAELASVNPQITPQAFTGFHSLIALAIYHCQDKDFAEMRKVLLNQIDTNSATGQLLGPKIVNAFPDPTTDTDIVPATIRWNLNVGRATLFAYIVLNGVVLVVCLTAQLVESCTTIGRKIQHMGTFTALDERCDGEIKNGDTRVELEDFQRLGEAEKLAKTASFHVVLAKKGRGQPLQVVPGIARKFSLSRRLSTTKEMIISLPLPVPRSQTAPARLDSE